MDLATLLAFAVAALVVVCVYAVDHSFPKIRFGQGAGRSARRR